MGFRTTLISGKGRWSDVFCPTMHFVRATTIKRTSLNTLLVETAILTISGYGVAQDLRGATGGDSNAAKTLQAYNKPEVLVKVLQVKPTEIPLP